MSGRRPDAFAPFAKLLGGGLLLLSAIAVPASDKEEPALGYTLRLDGEVVRLVPGKAVRIKGHFADPKATLVPDTERLFTYGQVTFKYPANFAFEADFDTEGIKMWTLDGNNFVIMVQQYETVEMTPKAFAEQLKELYGPKTKIESRSYTFNSHQYSGTRVHFTVAKQTLIQDILALPTKKGTRLLILQDNPPEEGLSAESKSVLKLLNESLKH
jgi:hypothetical protein